MNNWNKYKLSDILEIIGGGTPKTSIKEYWNGDISWISVKDFNNNSKYIFCTEKTITEQGVKKSSTKFLNKGDLIISARGTVGELAVLSKKMTFNQSCYGLRAKECTFNDFLYYIVKHSIYKLKSQTHGSVFDTITKETFNNIDILLPSIDEQKKISSILSSIDDKIELNSRINKNLEDQIFAYYKNIFVNNYTTKNECKAEDFFDISIGKTPPRKENEWFIKNENSIRWISISDMGKSGVYISKTTENLTKEAVEKFNIIKICDNTVILSFKLTVGRVAITDGEFVTNEAIAHFKTNRKEINPYLYCYLKHFSFENLGSTSSIANAVNSKIIKSMPFVIPNDNDLLNFNKLAIPYFEIINRKQKENSILENMRDNLLPKLLNGDINISDIDL